MWFLKFIVSLAAAILLGWVGTLTGLGWIAVAVGAFIGAHIIKITKALFHSGLGEILGDIFDFFD